MNIKQIKEPCGNYCCFSRKNVIKNGIKLNKIIEYTSIVIKPKNNKNKREIVKSGQNVAYLL